MLVFVIPLKSPKVSTSWNLVAKLCERTLKSICNQTSHAFRVIVVCNEKPSIEFSHPHITYIEVDFPVPSPDLNAKLLDQAQKSLVGLIHAKELQASHTMLVDADDCVSKQLAEFVNQNYQANGWYINQGYVYKEGGKLIYHKKNAFNKSCGTCRIIRYDLNDLPEKNEYASQALLDYIINHKKTETMNATLLEPLPFEGAVYTIGNKENIFQKDFGTLFPTKKAIHKRLEYALNFRFVNKSIRDNFSLYNIKF